MLYIFGMYSNATPAIRDNLFMMRRIPKRPYAHNHKRYECVLRSQSRWIVFPGRINILPLNAHENKFISFEKLTTQTCPAIYLPKVSSHFEYYVEKYFNSIAIKLLINSCLFPVRIHKMKILRLTRNLLKYEVNGQSFTTKTATIPEDIEPRAIQSHPMPRQNKKAAMPRKNRKKSIKVYGRCVRRPKRPLRACQVRT